MQSSVTKIAGFQFDKVRIQVLIGIIMINTYLLTTQSVSKTIYAVIGILKKAQTWSLESGTSEDTILEARLAPDMLPFVKQIQIISDNAKGMAARLTGIENPNMEDTETSLDDLIARLERTVEFVEAIPSESFDYAETAKIILPITPAGKYMTAETYVRDFALPNFFFHVVTAYAILRNLGMTLGKREYINHINLQDLE